MIDGQILINFSGYNYSYIPGTWKSDDVPKLNHRTAKGEKIVDIYVNSRNNCILWKIYMYFQISSIHTCIYMSNYHIVNLDWCITNLHQMKKLKPSKKIINIHTHVYP